MSSGERTELELLFEGLKKRFETKMAMVRVLKPMAPTQKDHIRGRSQERGNNQSRYRSREAQDHIDTAAKAMERETEEEEEKRQDLSERRLSSKLGGKPDDDSGDTLSADEVTRCRRIAARADLLAQDRMDIAFATKEATRKMTSPTKDDWNKLGRLGRYFVPYTRVVNWYKYQNESQKLVASSPIQTGLGAEGREDQHQAGAFTEDSTCLSSGARRKPWWL